MTEILILEGGFNEEHEVSLTTAKQVKKVFKKNKINYRSLIVNPRTFENIIDKYSNKLICFNALHGTFGEDGKIQKILKKKKFKFTHSGIYASKNCFNKINSKKMLTKYKIPTPIFFEIKPNFLNESNLNKYKKKFDKFIIKPNESGSSFGIRIIKTKNDLDNLIKNLKNYKKKLKYHNSLIIEKYIKGKELTVSVLEIYNKLQSLEVTEILSKNKFFDYIAKYSKGFAKHILPANIPSNIYKRCLRIALRAHKILKCNIISRTDFIYDKKFNKIFYLETNSQPGLTAISLLPEQAKFKNITFEEIILQLIKKINE